MNEILKTWFELLYKNEIEEVKGDIKNEQMWELGYNGEEPNPHTENIKMKKEYIEMLEEKLKEL